MLINNTILHNLKKNNLDILDYYVIVSKLNSENWTSIIRPPNETYDKLRKMGILNKSNEVSTQGLIIYNILNRNDHYSNDKQFNEFWEKFPSHDGFDNYDKTRNLRGKKLSCQRLYSKLLEEYSHEDIITGLENEITFRKNKSTNESNLKYMMNSHRWLKEKQFLLHQNDTSSSPAKQINIL